MKRLLSLPLYASSKETSDGEHEELMAERKHLFSDSPHQVPNHCLINEYLPGQGIHAHEDGGAYAPIVATISLGAPIVLDIFPKSGEGGTLQRNSRPQWRILQEERSLLISTGEMYTKHLHGIAAVKEDIDLQEVANWDFLEDKERFIKKANVRRTRVSLTFRDVLKVKKLGKGLKFLPR